MPGAKKSSKKGKGADDKPEAKEDKPAEGKGKGKKVKSDAAPATAAAPAEVGDAAAKGEEATSKVASERPCPDKQRKAKAAEKSASTEEDKPKEGNLSSQQYSIYDHRFQFPCCGGGDSKVLERHQCLRHIAQVLGRTPRVRDSSSHTF